MTRQVFADFLHVRVVLQEAPIVVAVLPTIELALEVVIARRALRVEPRAETRVRVLQRQWATPVPRVADLPELNAYLHQRCLAETPRTVAGYTESIGVRFARDQAKALPLPVHRFDACIRQPAQVDKYQTVRFDRNR